ncbi:MAG TPA: RagB/SusD family nutrient uptake outer membrane protein [Chitinophagaceae bacterium]
MYKKGFKIYLLVVAAIIISFTGCKKWLDTEAPLQVDQNTVYSSEQGFRDVLNGVYLQMGSRSLYGRDLTFGLLSVLGRSYDTTISPAIGNLYYEGARYNFQDAAVKAVFKNVWDSLYQCVGNLNNLLANIENKQSVFTGNNYNTIKGEALALRAYIHFDLLRMFAPSPAAAGTNVSAIPYITTLSPYATPVSTTGVVLDQCLADLQTAQSLLSNADMTTSRMTFWGVKGLLARLYLYKGDITNAHANALDVINSNKFPLFDNSSFNAANDLMFPKEHLFSLYSYLPISNGYYKTVLNTNPPLGLTVLNQTALFVAGSGATGDRRRAFIDPATGALNISVSNANISPRKFYAAYANSLPMIRMTEMYYIAAECATAKLDSLSATNWMDTVRVHRNLVKYTLTALKRDSLTVEIAKEYQKEFMGEGQVFYFYKRKNLPFSALPYTKVPVVANASYVFIKPE